MRVETSDEKTDEQSCADLLRALGDETRLLVVKHLMEGPLHVGELQERIGVEQSLLSHHLRNLRNTGIVTSERDGKAVLYRLAPEVERIRQGASLDLGCCALSFRPSCC